METNPFYLSPVGATLNISSQVICSEATAAEINQFYLYTEVINFNGLNKQNVSFINVYNKLNRKCILVEVCTNVEYKPYLASGVALDDNVLRLDIAVDQVQ
jgi:hypothetical protein